jgi:TfoX/Sxy family transcriptional regulator of competence genes
MFGEYALYKSGKVIGLICDDTLFIKITDQGKQFAGDDYQEGFPYPGAKAWMSIDSDLLEHHEWLCELVQITEEFAPEPKKKKNRR